MQPTRYSGLYRAVHSMLEKRSDAKKPRKFRWTPKSERAAELLAEGRTKVDAAEEVGVHRNSILLWMQHPDFAERVESLSRAYLAEARTRRQLQATRFADRAATQLEQAFDFAEKDPAELKDATEAEIKLFLGAPQLARQWGAEFRAWREQERVEAGDDVRRTEVNVTGGIDVRASQKVSLKAFLISKVEDGVIDVPALPSGGDAGTVVAGLLTQALASDPAVLDLLVEEDRVAEEALRAQEEGK